MASSSTCVFSAGSVRSEPPEPIDGGGRRAGLTLRGAFANGLTAEHAAGAAFTGRGGDRRKIIRHPVQLLFGDGVEEPQKQEKGHHRGHEVGIRNFPRATMMAVSSFLDPLDDDRSAALSLRRRRQNLAVQPFPNPIKSEVARIE